MTRRRMFHVVAFAIAFAIILAGCASFRTKHPDVFDNDAWDDAQSSRGFNVQVPRMESRRAGGEGA